jgi:hypothetical protein
MAQFLALVLPSWYEDDTGGMMIKKGYSIALIFMLSAVLIAASDSQQSFNRHGIGIYYVWPHYVATDTSFDGAGNLGAGYEFMVTPRIGIGISWTFSQWHDYLGMYCGKYTVNVQRPALDLSYYLTSRSARRLVPFASLSLCYNKIDMTNELCNPYDGNVRSHFALVPGFGIHLLLWHLKSGKRIVLSLRLSYALNGPFDNPSGFWGLGFQF